MADNFGLKIGVEGEKEFKNSLREINQSFKVLGSEMKLVSSEFDKNDKSIQAVSARNAVLTSRLMLRKRKSPRLKVPFKMHRTALVKTINGLRTGQFNSIMLRHNSTAWSENLRPTRKHSTQ